MANSDNPARGAAFERAVQQWLMAEGLTTSLNFQVDVGAASERRVRKFDLGCAEPATLVECKRHTWTKGGNAPSAKLTVWNEAMYYFACTPREYRKMLVVQRNLRDGESLAEHYISRCAHLVPAGIELWEFDEESRDGRKLFTAT